MVDKLLTVITPTYNRGYTLNNVYKSLQNQTIDLFIWMIIDDGSTDNTETLVRKWKNEEKISIVYLKKENGGKASALNLAFDNVTTKYWVVLDSDDIFVETAVENGISELKKTESEDEICGVIAVKHFLDGEIIGGKPIPKELKNTTLAELRQKHLQNSEYVTFYKTHTTRDYRFPQIPGEKFIAPGYFLHTINKKYKFKVAHQVYCLCEYLDDGLTKNKLKVIKKNPKGYTIVIKAAAENATSFKEKSLLIIKYISGSVLSREKITDIINNSPHKAMTFIYYPMGWVFSKIRYR